jgi:hypothetical protein
MNIDVLIVLVLLLAVFGTKFVWDLMKAINRGTLGTQVRNWTWWAQKAIGTAMLGIGLFLLGMMARNLLKVETFIRTAAHANGSIMMIETTRGGSHGPNHFPVYIFKDTLGKQHVVHSRVPSSQTDFSEGQPVEVLYQADYPQKAFINTFSQLWSNGLGLGVLDLLFIIFGLNLICGFERLRARRRWQERHA